MFITMRTALRQSLQSRLSVHIPHCAAGTRDLSTVNSISSSLDELRVEDFRRQAFLPEQPLLITASNGPIAISAASSSIPAIAKWFTLARTGKPSLNCVYLEKFKDIVLPYELVSDLKQESTKAVPNEVVQSPTFDKATFQRFNAPLQLFLTSAQLSPPPQLYIAQAKLVDLPQQLRDDLPTPSIILEAGKGDIYDSNIWMGIPPTYTPLHKDPNPNLFVQLASDKVVRIFEPHIGISIFQEVQAKIGSQTSASFRGDEMMQGPEKVALEDVVWNCPDSTAGYEVMVRPGDALFIPKGWWHSIRSHGNDITASVSITAVLREH